MIIALIVVQWAYFARAARGAALVERGKEYVEAARCMSLGWGRVLFRHVLPNCMPPLIVIATIDLAHAIALEATLSFLGVGVPVSEPSLGMLIYNGFEYLLSGQYWISFFPASRWRWPSSPSTWWATTCAMCSTRATRTRGRCRKTLWTSRRRRPDPCSTCVA